MFAEFNWTTYRTTWLQNKSPEIELLIKNHNLKNDFKGRELPVSFEDFMSLIFFVCGYKQNNRYTFPIFSSECSQSVPGCHPKATAISVI
jgi:hypothetical protein